MKIYGLKNCDTTRKALKIIEEGGGAAEIHDLRKDGLPDDLLKEWIAKIGWESLLNKRGTTWRGLPDDVKEDINAEKAEKLMREHPALIKRPIWDRDGKGFSVGLKKSK